MATIPLSIPHLNGNELKYVSECIETGWISSAGAFVTQFEEKVASYVNMDYGIAASNGTCGLHLAMHILGVKETDYVIVPNITFIASANSVAYTNAEPIFIDIDPETWQMDLDLLESFLANNTIVENDLCYLVDSATNSKRRISAIMPVHVLGNMCDMPRLRKMADRYHIFIVEDASESLGSYWKGVHSGSWGDLSVFSFNGNKIITTGGGGVIVTNNKKYAVRAKHLSTQSKVNPETYYHDEIGFNYRLVNVLAAIGVAQMEQLPEFINKKKEQLFGIGDIKFQKVRVEVDPNCWLFTFYTKKQSEILAKLKDNQIIARPFWTPMNQLPMFVDKKYISINNFSKDIHLNCLSIPSSISITRKQQEKVVQCIKSCF